MSIPDQLISKLVGARQDLRLVGPMGKIRLIETGETWVGPCRDMDPIGNGAQMIAAKNLVGGLRMAFRYSIDLAA